MNAAQRILLLVDLLTDERAAVYARDQEIARLRAENEQLAARVAELEPPPARKRAPRSR